MVKICRFNPDLTHFSNHIKYQANFCFSWDPKKEVKSYLTREKFSKHKRTVKLIKCHLAKLQSSTPSCATEKEGRESF